MIAAAAAFPITSRDPRARRRPELRGRRRTCARSRSGPVEPWSAESPRLYSATVRSAGETVSPCDSASVRSRIDGDQLTVNGAQVTFRGMNRHETHPVRGRVFDEDHARADLIMMKQAGVNAIRTSHYPPHPRVLDLADELGFWVIDECDLETHGFVFRGWRGNPSDDPRWERPTWTGSSARSSGTRTTRR